MHLPLLTFSTFLTMRDVYFRNDIFTAIILFSFDWHSQSLYVIIMAEICKRVELHYLIQKEMTTVISGL